MTHRGNPIQLYKIKGTKKMSSLQPEYASITFSTVTYTGPTRARKYF